MATLKVGNFAGNIWRARLRIARIGGLRISIHWSWFPFLVVWVAWGVNGYSSRGWAALEFVGVFLIVLMHELGHVAASFRLGQKAPEIILWPLGGLALLETSNRWATELLIAGAGPAVNVLLVPVTCLSWYWFGYRRGGDVSLLLWRLAWVNVWILVSNLLPIWPLDGGRIALAAMTARLRPARSRFVICAVGMTCAAAAMVWLVHVQDFVGVAFATALMLLNVAYFQWSLAMMAFERRRDVHDSAVCPNCRSPAFDGAHWACRNCGRRYNPFANRGHCWNCKQDGGAITCFYCGKTSPVAAWFATKRRDQDDWGQDPSAIEKSGRTTDANDHA
jgi:Zn-dependent protease